MQTFIFRSGISEANHMELLKKVQFDFISNLEGSRQFYHLTPDTHGNGSVVFNDSVFFVVVVFIIVVVLIGRKWHVHLESN